MLFPEVKTNGRETGTRLNLIRDRKNFSRRIWPAIPKDQQEGFKYSLNSSTSSKFWHASYIVTCLTGNPL